METTSGGTNSTADRRRERRGSSRERAARHGRIRSPGLTTGPTGHIAEMSMSAATPPDGGGGPGQPGPARPGSGPPGNGPPGNGPPGNGPPGNGPPGNGPPGSGPPGSG